MEKLLWKFSKYTLLLTLAAALVVCLKGKNVCIQEQQFSQIVNITEKLPYQIYSYGFCYQIPPICVQKKTSYHIRERPIERIITKNVEVCCKGYQQQGDQCIPFNEFTHPYEPLVYDRESIRLKNRFKRSEDQKFSLNLNFTAYNRSFRLHLRPDPSIFASSVTFQSTKRGLFHYNTHNALIGKLLDDDNSSIEGIITSNGLFDGMIETSMGIYYIEPSSRYTNLNSQLFHSIIYRIEDISFPLKSCLSIKSNFTIDNKEDDLLSNRSFSSSSSFFTDDTNNRKLAIKARYTRDVNSDIKNDNNRFWRDFDALNYFEAESEPYGVRAIQRTHWPEERHERHFVIDPKKTTCMLYLQADHLFYEKMGSEEACIETMTRHVQKVNSIYRSTDFDQDGRSDNISFLIKRIKVHTNEALKDPDYRFPGSYGVEKFLELFSEEDYDAFCLAYMFTYRDFEGGTLGLAWTGDLKNAGGVCEKNGHYRGSLKSLNTGIVTLLNYGKHVPPIVSHVTLAHEIGHNFGSPHDPENDGSCTPGGENGNYIMFARATSGDKRNNNHFSPCSLKSINAVLNSKARSLKGCFQEPQESICGNEVVEAGEECDCGWEEDCTESCCFPMRTNAPKNETPCRLRPNVICSPTQGPCCGSDCRLKIGDKCRDDNGCRTSSYCNGQGPECPSSTNKPNKTICNDEFVCYLGECTGSICIAYGLESCQCKRETHEPETKLCELCCRLPGDDSSCKSSFEWNTEPFDVPDLHAKPGTPCDNYNGYCDNSWRCREIDPSGPLATLKRLLLSNESMASIRRWLNEQWICLILLCIMALLIAILVVKLLEKRNLERKISLNPIEEIYHPSSASSMVQNYGNFIRTSLAWRQHMMTNGQNRDFHSPISLSGNEWV